MTALAKDRNTPRRDGVTFVLPVAATTKIYAGSIVAINASGDALPAADTAGLKVVGMAEEYVDNTGAAGALTVRVRTGVFQFVGASLTKADVGKVAYVADDQTVAVTSTNFIGAGQIVAVESASLAWVAIGLMERRAGIVASVASANADATYGQPEADLINELKAQVNALLATLRATGLIGT